MTSSETNRHHSTMLADLGAYLDLFETWSRARRREVLPACQLGYLQSPPVRRGRHRPVIPLLQLLVDPDWSFDFADPRTGFSGLGRTPDRDRRLTVWADNLVSVQHGEDWIYVIDSDYPLADEWLRLLRPADGSSPPPYAVVTATFDGPAPIGEFSLTEVEAVTHTTLVRVEDRRRGASSR